jgi:hypothetical protein
MFGRKREIASGHEALPIFLGVFEALERQKHRARAKTFQMQ